MELETILALGEWMGKQLRPAKVLLAVEDSSEDCLLLEEQLRIVGFKYEIARSGEEALGMMKKTRFSAALLDIGLPGISGLTLARRMADKYPKTRLFFVTGSSFITLDEGQFMRIIRKPITANALRQIVI